MKAFGRRCRSVPRHGLLSDTASVHTFILSSETQGPSDLVWVSFFPSPGPVWKRSRGWKPSLRSVSGLQMQMLEGSQGPSGQHKCLHSGTRSQASSALAVSKILPMFPLLVENTFLSPPQEGKSSSFEGTLDFLPQLGDSESRMVRTSPRGHG